MKKRIKLTDKELAIGMWVYICLFIESYDTEDAERELIVKLKQNWLLAHGVKSYRINLDYKWRNDCYFCEKYYYNTTCRNCPLQSCTTGSLYDSVIEYYHNKDKQSKALECAKRILNVILAEKEVSR